MTPFRAKRKYKLKVTISWLLSQSDVSSTKNEDARKSQDTCCNRWRDPHEVCSRQMEEPVGYQQIVLFLVTPNIFANSASYCKVKLLIQVVVYFQMCSTERNC